MVTAPPLALKTAPARQQCSHGAYLWRVKTPGLQGTFDACQAHRPDKPIDVRLVVVALHRDPQQRPALPVEGRHLDPVVVPQSPRCTSTGSRESGNSTDAICATSRHDRQAARLDETLDQGLAARAHLVPPPFVLELDRGRDRQPRSRVVRPVAGVPRANSARPSPR